MSNWFDDDDEEGKFTNRITLRYYEKDEAGDVREVDFELKNKQSYDELVERFVYFLQAVGYTYVSGLTVLDQDGEEIFTTSM